VNHSKCLNCLSESLKKRKKKPKVIIWPRRSFWDQNQIFQFSVEKNVGIALVTLIFWITRLPPLQSVTGAMHAQSPVRVLIKHSPGACLLPFIDMAVLSCEKMVDDPKAKLIHYFGLGYITSVSSATFTLQVNEPPSDVWWQVSSAPDSIAILRHSLSSA
jgi:hypothetical protein